MIFKTGKMTKRILVNKSVPLTHKRVIITSIVLATS